MPQKPLKTFIKPSEAPQSVKIKIYVNFFSSSGIGTVKVSSFLDFDLLSFSLNFPTRKKSANDSFLKS